MHQKTAADNRIKAKEIKEREEKTDNA